MIAFTSDFVPKMMYYMVKGSMIGYVDSSLSHFDATEFDFSRSQFQNVTSCRYVFSFISLISICHLI